MKFSGGKLTGAWMRMPRAFFRKPLEAGTLPRAYAHERVRLDAARLRPYLILALVVLGFRLLTALPLERAGYMDASYTVHVGGNLAQGRGLVQDVVWNYLDGTTQLPAPSNLYWLPLPSLLAGGSMALLGNTYRAAQLPFILLSLVPPLFAFYLARRVYRRDDYAWVAGLLTAFSGFYTIYWVSPDNFTPFAVAADLALLFMALGVVNRAQKYFLLAGLCVGLCQLARADAIVLLAVLPLLLWLHARPGWMSLVTANAAAWAGFLLVCLPWFLRNLLVIGSPLAPGSAQTLWLLNYDEFFSFDVGRITLARYLEWGWANILASKLQALGFVILVLLFGVWQIFLAPFAAVGFWLGRRRVELQAALIYLGLLVGVMAFVFTFPATHGSMLHSAAALVAFGAVAVPPGLDAAVAWAAQRRRSWDVKQAQRFFRAGAIALAGAFSVYLYAAGVWIPPGADATTPLWNDRDIEYAAIDRELDARGVPAESPIITVDPPSFVNVTGRRSIYLPTESVEAIFGAADRFGAEYLVLQYDKPVTLRALYDGRENIEGLARVAGVADGLGRQVTLYRIER